MRTGQREDARARNPPVRGRMTLTRGVRCFYRRNDPGGHPERQTHESDNRNGGRHGVGDRGWVGETIVRYGYVTAPAAGKAAGEWREIPVSIRTIRRAAYANNAAIKPDKCDKTTLSAPSRKSCRDKNAGIGQQHASSHPAS